MASTNLYDYLPNAPNIPDWAALVSIIIIVIILSILIYKWVRNVIEELDEDE